MDNTIETLDESVCWTGENPESMEDSTDSIKKHEFLCSAEIERKTKTVTRPPENYKRVWKLVLYSSILTPVVFSICIALLLRYGTPSTSILAKRFVEKLNLDFPLDGIAQTRNNCKDPSLLHTSNKEWIKVNEVALLCQI